MKEEKKGRKINRQILCTVISKVDSPPPTDRNALALQLRNRSPAAPLIVALPALRFWDCVLGSLQFIARV